MSSQIITRIKSCFRWLPYFRISHALMLIFLFYVIKGCVIEPLLAPSLEEDFHGNSVLAQHGIIEIPARGRVSINEHYAGSAMQDKLYKLNLFNKKIIVLAIWSTNCSTCSFELSNINDFLLRHNLTTKNGFIFLTIADPYSKPEAIKKLFTQNQWQNLYDFFLKKTDLLDQLDIDPGDDLPKYYLVDKNGMIFAEMLHPIWDQKDLLEPLLAYSVMDEVISTDYELSLIEKSVQKK